jgi:cobalt-zinc-cadmium efflux system protein
VSSSHPHTHAQEHAGDERRLLYAMLLTGGFTVVELVGGLISGSLVLLADAGHMLTDTAALLLAWLAARTARRPADRFRSYGYHRVQILAAFVNGVALLAVVAWILVEAAQRLLAPHPVMGGLMLGVAVAGLVVNLLAFALLHGGRRSDLNLRAALVHVLGDLLGSVAAIAAAIVIVVTGWLPIDPLLSVLVALLIARSAWYVVRRSTHILLEGTPDDVDVQSLRAALLDGVAGVRDVHHVHLWSLTPERPLLTLHLDVGAQADTARVLREAKGVLRQRFGIHHSTVQVEREGCVDEGQR